MSATTAQDAVAGIEEKYRTCLDTGLKVYSKAETLIKVNAVTAVIFLAVGGLFGVLVALTFDPAQSVRAKASESLSRLPDAVVDQVLGADVHAGVLDWFARSSAESEARLEKIALNAATADATYCFLASLKFPRVLDIVAGNQVRLLRLLGLLQKPCGARESLRCDARYAGLLRLRKQCLRPAQMLSLDCGELGGAVQGLGFAGALARVIGISGFEATRGSIEYRLGFLPKRRRKRLGFGIRS